MTRLNGRPFAFLVMLIGGWIGSRLWMMPDAVDLPPTPKDPGKPIVAQATARSFVPDRADRPDQFANTRLFLNNNPVQTNERHGAMPIGRRSPLIVSIPQVRSSPSVAIAFQSRDNAHDAASPPLFPAGQVMPAKQDSFALYAYSFWRGGNGRNSLATGGQYGGSQSGVIATWDVGSVFPPLRGKRVSLLARLSAAHNDHRDREVALGARWQPLTSLPVSLSAEQRFRLHGPDRVAVYVAGGVDHIALPADFDFDSYGQAGWASGQGGGYFFDGSARILHKVVTGNTATVTAGGGTWTGGQRGGQRLDIGPSLRSQIKLGSVPLTIAADWRFRVAGNAQPGNGPALTLSTAF